MQKHFEIKPVNVEPLKEQVARHLRRAILSGALPPGTRLPETELAERFQVSRGPVREALQLLAQEGLVAIVQRRGAVVSELDLTQAWEVYMLRGHLELIAVGVLRQQPERLDAQALETVLARMEAVVQQEDSDPLEWVELDLEFHAHLCAMSGLQRLQQLHQSLDSLVGALFMTARRILKRRPQDLPRVHEPIVRALAEGDFERAEYLVGEHYFLPARRIQALLDAERKETASSQAAEPSGAGEVDLRELDLWQLVLRRDR